MSRYLLLFVVTFSLFSNMVFAETSSYRAFIKKYEMHMTETLDICQESGINYFTIFEIEMAKNTAFNEAIGNSPDGDRIRNAHDTHLRCIQTSIRLNEKYLSSIEKDGRCQPLISAFREHEISFLSGVPEIGIVPGDTFQSWSFRMAGFKAQVQVFTPRLLDAACN